MNTVEENLNNKHKIVSFSFKTIRPKGKLNRTHVLPHHKYHLRSNSLRSTERKLFSSYILQFTMICKVDEDMVGCSHNPNCFYLLSVIQYKHTKHY